MNRKPAERVSLSGYPPDRCIYHRTELRPGIFLPTVNPLPTVADTVKHTALLLNPDKFFRIVTAALQLFKKPVERRLWQRRRAAHYPEIIVRTAAY